MKKEKKKLDMLCWELFQSLPKQKQVEVAIYLNKNLPFRLLYQNKWNWRKLYRFLKGLTND